MGTSHALDALIERYQRVRAFTERLSEPLSDEDQLLQSMPNCSPTKWHRAHTTWFFETFVLGRLGVAPLDARASYLWNSYYEAVGERHPRPQRGLLSRPSAAEVGSYRRAVDGRVCEVLAALDAGSAREIAPIVVLGLAHEEQHQELILTDILHAFSLSPLRPAYRAERSAPRLAGSPAPHDFAAFPGGLVEIGRDAGAGFAFDNEGPRHRVWLEPFRLATRLLTVGEVRAFIDAGGYRTPALWLAEGWDWVRREGIQAPLHADYRDGAYRVFTLEGEREAAADEPACHVSFYEADALARFFDARLPTEAEWETALAGLPVTGHLLDLEQPLRPLPARASHDDAGALSQTHGDTWVWTQSAYAPYPGFAPASGALGEYNAKFMVNQLVLRGGSCLTPEGHVRTSYRNFWYPDTRFQMTGVRLAKGIPSPLRRQGGGGGGERLRSEQGEVD